MLEPLSEPLRSLLLELKLCSARDLRRCRGSVRSLTHDLPAFDSVWLDALVQIRRLTPFQSRVLASAKPDRLRIGPCLLVDRLGGGPLGETFLARPIAGHELCVVKRVNDRDGIGVSADGAARIENLVAGLQDFGHPSCVGPHSVVSLPSPSGRGAGGEGSSHGDSISQPQSTRPHPNPLPKGEGAMVLVSRFVPGPTLGELLVRRGRYSADVVSEVGRQLLDGLAALERRGLAHGDIRLANVRLTDGGVAVLLDAGVRSALDPELTVHSGLAPDRYDGVAPELIGTGRPPNAASDLYALGCLLWQLLAGRPPFPGGDPLGKIAAHQTKTIDDVRRWAPDTPSELAEQIRRLTARDAAARPQHIADAVAAWGSPRRSGRRRLVRFLRTFSSPAETEPNERRASPLRWALLLAALFAISGVAVSLADKGARAELLDVSNRVRDWVGSRLAKQPPTSPNGDHPGSQSDGTGGLPRSTQTTLPLPAPDSDGVISLKSNGPFEASKITSIGPLTIKGQRDVRPIIVVSDKPLEIAAEVVRLENVHLRRSNSATAVAPTKSLLRVQCQNLNVDQCSFETHAFDVVRSRSADATSGARTFDELPVALAWKVAEDRDPSGGRIELRDTIFSGAAPAIHLASAPRQLQCDNCLKLGPGPLFHLATSPDIDARLRAGRKVSVRLQGVTCRRSGSIIRWNLPDNWQPTSSPVLVVETNDCVLDLLPGQSALIELASAAAKPTWLRSAHWTGDGSLAPADLWVAAVSQPSPPGLTQLDAKEFSIDGISNSPFRFAGDFGNSPTDSATLDWEAPRFLPNPPGIRASRLIWPVR